MLTSLLFGIICTVILYAWGLSVLSIIYPKSATPYSFHFAYLIGLCTVSLLTNWATIFSGTNSIIGSFILVAPLIYQHRYLSLNKIINDVTPNSISYKFLAICLLLTCICIHAWEIKHPDTLTYQNSLIHNAITGPQPIGNIVIKPQLGYGGAWFPLAAIFSFEWLIGKTMTFVNLSLVGVSIIYLINKIESALNKQQLGSMVGYLVVLAIGCYEYTFFRLAITSAAPDTPAAILGIATLIYFIKNGRQSWMLILLSFTAVTIKLSLAPILLLPVWDLLQKKNMRNWIRCIGVGILIMTPFFTKNILSTGYAIYPFPASKILEESFVPEKHKVQEEANYITAYARNIAVTRDSSQVKYIATQSMRQWVPTWWKQLDVADRTVIALFFIGIIGCMGAAYRSPDTLQVQIPVLTVIIIGAFYWFSLAPAIRFGTTFLLAPLLLYSGSKNCITFERLTKRTSIRLHKGVMLISTGIVLAYFIYRMINFMDGMSILLPKGPVS